MTLTTTNMGLLQAQGSDNARDYLKTYLAQSLGLIDVHDHSSGKGLPVKRIQNGTFAARPAAGNAGHVYVATDASRFTLDNGSSWIEALINGTTQSVLLGGGLTVAGSLSLPANSISNLYSFDITSGSGTASTTAAAFPSFTTGSVTFSGKPCLVLVSGSFAANTAGTIAKLYIQLDTGLFSPIAEWGISTINQIQHIFASTVLVPTAGSHTVNVGWSISAGTLSADTGNDIRMQVLDLKF